MFADNYKQSFTRENEEEFSYYSESEDEAAN